MSITNHCKTFVTKEPKQITTTGSNTDKLNEVFIFNVLFFMMF